MSGDATLIVGVRELKNRLTTYLRLTKANHEIVVTERGKPIARIRPIQSADDVASREAKLATLAAKGVVTLPTRPLPKKVRPVKISGRPLAATILEDRR